MTAIVRANARKERAALERLLVLEASLRDIANASAQSQAELQARIDKGVTDLAIMMETARRTTEDREAALREQINGALQKVRAYARDMEEALEQERLKLEEVVKMEIKARITTSEQLKELIGAQVGVRISEAEDSVA
jgi:predicted phage gp36 major capsid-like protein